MSHHHPSPLPVLVLAWAASWVAIATLSVVACGLLAMV